MNPDILFLRAIDEYNVWYKFVNSEKFNYEAYKTFSEALHCYIMVKKYNKANECYSWIIKCLIESTNTNHLITLANTYEEYGDFIKIYNQKGDKIEYLLKADNVYSRLGYIDDIIRVKIKMRELLKTSLKHQLKLSINYHKTGSKYLTNCIESFKEFDINVSQSIHENNIIDNILPFITNSKTQEVISEKIRKNMGMYIKLGYEIMDYKLRKSYIDFKNNNKRIPDDIIFDSELVRLLD